MNFYFYIKNKQYWSLKNTGIFYCHSVNVNNMGNIIVSLEIILAWSFLSQHNEHDYENLRSVNSHNFYICASIFPCPVSIVEKHQFKMIPKIVLKDQLIYFICHRPVKCKWLLSKPRTETTTISMHANSHAKYIP